MGHNAGWLNLYAGVAGGADIILIPEIPYDADKVIESVENRVTSGKSFSIIAMAEGAVDKTEANMSKSEFNDHMATMPYHTSAYRLAKQIQDSTGLESRVVSPGHTVRGGSPSPYDRLLSTRFGVHAAKLIKEKQFGRTIALVNNKITSNKLADVAGKLKLISPQSSTIKDARNLGISFGD